MSLDDTTFRDADFLNRDFDSYLGLMSRTLDRTGTAWKQRSPADPGMMVVDLLAYELDHLAQAADRVSTESFLQTARLRGSLRMHAALAGFIPEESAAGTGFQHVELREIPCARCSRPRCACHGELAVLPAGTRFSTDPDLGTPVFFESLDDVRVSAWHNGFTLRQRVLRGERHLPLAPSPSSAPSREWTTDLRLLRLYPGMRLAVGAGSKAEAVRVAAVFADGVELDAPLAREHAVDSVVRGNLVRIREGTTTEVRFLAGLARNRTSWHTWIQARVGEVVRASDALELCRDTWAGDDAQQRRWTRAQELLQDTVSALRTMPRVYLESRQGAWPRADAELEVQDVQLRKAWHLLDAIRSDADLVSWERGGLEALVSEDFQTLSLGREHPVVWSGQTPQIPHVQVWTRPVDEALWLPWTVVEDLFESTPADRHVQVLAENDSSVRLRFPDGNQGCRPGPGDTIRVSLTHSPPTANNPAARQILFLDHLPRVEGGVRETWITSTLNPVPVTGSAAPQSPEDIRREIATGQKWFAAPATLADLRTLALEQPGVAEATVRVVQAMFQVTVRLEPGAPPETLTDVQRVFQRHRQVSTFVAVLEARPRPVRVSLVSRALADQSPELTRSRVRQAVQAWFAGRLGHSLGQPVTPHDIESCLQGLTAWTDVQSLAYGNATGDVDDTLTVASDRYLDLAGHDADEDDAVLVRLARVYSIHVSPLPGFELTPERRQQVYDLLSGADTALGSVIDARRIERVLLDAHIRVRVGAVFDGTVRTAGMRLAADEVPYLESIEAWGSATA